MVRFLPRRQLEATADTPAAPEAAVPSARPRRRRRSLLVRVLVALLPGRRHRRFRYVTFALVGFALIWGPIIAYLAVTPKSYTADVGLILPGAGALTSISVSDIGQATSSSPSAYGGTSLSPTVTYKNLLMSDTVLRRAAGAVGTTVGAFGVPIVKLVPETSLITFSLSARSPEQASRNVEALFDAFQTELDRLRDDEIQRREHATREVIGQYEDSVHQVRSQIDQLQITSGLNSTDQYNSVIATAEALRNRLVEARAALADASGSVDRLSASLHVSPDIAAKTIRLHSDPEFGALMETVGKTSADAAELAARYGSRHPLMEAARERLTGARQKALARAVALTGLHEAQLANEIDAAPTGNRAALMSELLSAIAARDGKAAEARSLSEDFERSNQRVKSLVEPAARLESLNRDYKIAEAVFASALARVDTVKADIFASYPMVQVVAPAKLPDRPSSPKVSLALGAGVGASVFLIISLLLGSVRRKVIDRLIARGQRLGHPGVPVPVSPHD